MSWSLVGVSQRWMREASRGQHRPINPIRWAEGGGSGLLCKRDWADQGARSTLDAWDNFPCTPATLHLHSSSVPDPSQISFLRDISLVSVPVRRLPFSITCTCSTFLIVLTSWPQLWGQWCPNTSTSVSLASGALPGIYSVLSVWVCVCVYSVHVHRPIICKSTHTYEMQTKTLIQIPPLPPPWAHPPPAVPSLLWSPSPLSSREFRSSSLFTWRISRKFSSVCPPCSQCYLLLVLRFFFFV